MTAILSVRDLEKTFGSIVAARDITLDVPAQQTVGIIGANGAGKTTFINMITGHLRPTKGTIRLEDRDITGWPSREITRLGISRSFARRRFLMFRPSASQCPATWAAVGPESARLPTHRTKSSICLTARSTPHSPIRRSRDGWKTWAARF